MESIYMRIKKNIIKEPDKEHIPDIGRYRGRFGSFPKKVKKAILNDYMESLWDTSDIYKDINKMINREFAILGFEYRPDSRILPIFHVDGKKQRHHNEIFGGLNGHEQEVQSLFDFPRVFEDKAAFLDHMDTNSFGSMIYDCHGRKTALKLSDLIQKLKKKNHLLELEWLDIPVSEIKDVKEYKDTEPQYYKYFKISEKSQKAIRIKWFYKKYDDKVIELLESHLNQIFCSYINDCLWRVWRVQNSVYKFNMYQELMNLDYLDNFYVDMVDYIKVKKTGDWENINIEQRSEIYPFNQTEEDGSISVPVIPLKKEASNIIAGIWD